ncbi:MAG: tRNA (adenosine(37)-N6)-threonylcarbamoyltransferase complex ATPase subunit type 1 TsaE [Clostridia bacterium]|nr:tRNA (adenosine(37)-N6)-threonylcarbamoyltransferase complex ATPase subunit type 1 TsaE [Clostridia bacterium]
MDIITHTVEETELAGAELAKALKPFAVVTLYGDLGAGKTAFVRGIARGLNSPNRVTSPTFTIVNEYSGTLELFHFDMYRLESSDELFEIGWEDYLARGGVCVIEWSENVSDAFDGTEIKVNIEKLTDTDRKITVEDTHI